MFTPTLGEPYIGPYITVNNTRLGIVDIFVYLGSTVSRDGFLDAKIYLHVSNTSVDFGKLEKSLG